MKPKSQTIKRLDSLEERIRGASGASAVSATETEANVNDSSANVTEAKNET